ncbi:MAG: hypothetical protein QXH78_03530 [Desulfurococcaceae archaeon]
MSLLRASSTVTFLEFSSTCICISCLSSLIISAPGSLFRIVLRRAFLIAGGLDKTTLLN